MLCRPTRGLTLLEVILAIVIATIVAMIGLHFIRPTGAHSRQKACDLTRQTIQLEVGRYHDRTGHFPRANLSDLVSPTYLPQGVPVCPSQGGAFVLRGSEVVCPLHETTRVP